MNEKSINLYDQIVDLYYDNSEWNYYNADFIKPFDKNKARNFIERYFEKGAKKGVILPLIDRINSMRYVHMISVFFIGLLIKRKLCPRLTICSQVDTDYEFTYLWFLVCLFHDMGYAIENDWTYKFTYRKKTEEYKNKYAGKVHPLKMIYSRYEDLGVFYMVPTIYRKQGPFQKIYGKNNIKNLDSIIFNNGIKVYKSTYERETVFNYLEYCKMTDEIRHYDHGIVGGLWLYDNLIKNYYITYLSEKEKRENVNFDDFYVNEHLHFFAEQKMIFAYLADCIIAHNMWPATGDKIQIYRKFRLDELIPPKFEKIKFEKNPILFILAIADTIDPIKLFLSKCSMNEVDIWKGVDVLFTRGYIEMKIVDYRLSFKNLVNKLKGLDDWIDVRIDIKENEKKIKLVLGDGLSSRNQCGQPSVNLRRIRMKNSKNKVQK